MDPVVQEPALFDVAVQCSILFRKCRVESKRHQTPIVEELEARFNLWAAYTGVFAENDMSLDNRLLLHPDVKRMTLNLLYMVERNLQVASTASIDQHIPSPSQIDVVGLDEYSSLSKLLEFHGASFQGLSAVPVALNRLHKLATAIRRSSLESRKEKLLTKIWDSDQDAYMGECIYKFVQGRFPNARDSLLKHLTAAVCSQRRRLLYLPRHNKRLKIQRKSKQQIVVERPPLPQTFHLPQLPIKRSYECAFTEPISATDASIPNSMQLRRLLGRAIRPPLSVSSTGSALQAESLLYPEVPTFAAGDKFHPCPYCSEPLHTSKLDLEIKSNSDYWRNHVNQDLEPYFCLSEECKEPLKFFIHYSDWREHMCTSHTDEWYRSAHMLTWYCDLGHPERELFVDKESFESHTKDFHPTLTMSQLRARAKKSKTFALREPLACPMCEFVPTKISVLLPHHHNYKKCRDSLFRHIAFHIKALSLISFRFLLNGHNIDQIDDTATKGPCTEASTNRMARSFQDMSLGNEKEMPWSPIDNSQTSEKADAEPVELGLETVDANARGVDWGYLPGFDHLSKYSGVTNQEPQTGMQRPVASVSPRQTATPKNVAFELLFMESPPHRARLPMRVQIHPHDDTDSIVTTVKNFYGLYSGPTCSKGVSFEDQHGRTLIAEYKNFRDNMVVYVRVFEEPPVASTSYSQQTSHQASIGTAQSDYMQDG